MLSACVSQSAYEQQAQSCSRLRPRSQQLQAQIAEMQARAELGRRRRPVVPGGRLSAQRQRQDRRSASIVPKLHNLQNAKVVVYGYTDNLPVGPALQRAGHQRQHRPVVAAGRRRRRPISARRASTRTSSRPRGSATRIRSPRTTRREDRAKNRRIEITVQGQEPRRVNSSRRIEEFRGRRRNSRPRLGNFAR